MLQYVKLLIKIEIRQDFPRRSVCYSAAILASIQSMEGSKCISCLDIRSAEVIMCCSDHKDLFWPRLYKTFFMLNSAEHENFPAHKC